MRQDELNHIESSQRQHFDVLQHQEVMNTLVERAEYNLFALLKPRVYPDGNSWCVLLGDNIQEGICGFGETPFKAIIDFSRAFHRPINPPNSGK